MPLTRHSVDRLRTARLSGMLEREIRNAMLYTGLLNAYN